MTPRGCEDVSSVSVVTVVVPSLSDDDPSVLCVVTVEVLVLPAQPAIDAVPKLMKHTIAIKRQLCLSIVIIFLNFHILFLSIR